MLRSRFLRFVSSTERNFSNLHFSVVGNCGEKKFCTSSVKCNSLNVFDRRAKLLQRERAAANPDVDNYDFLKEEVGYRHKALTSHIHLGHLYFYLYIFKVNILQLCL